MKAECILPSNFDELQKTLDNMGISIQQFFLDEKIDPKQRQDILTAALGERDAENFTKVANAKIQKYLTTKAEKELAREKIKANVVEDMVLNRIRRLQGKITPEYEGKYLENLIQSELKLAVSQKQAEQLVSAQASVDAALEDMNNALDKNESFKGQNYKDIYKESDVEKIREDEVLNKKYVTLGLALVKYRDTYAEIQQSLLSKTNYALAKKFIGSTRSAILSADMSFGRNISNMFFVRPDIGWKSWIKGTKAFAQDLWYGTSKDANGFTKKDYAWANIYAHPNVVSGRLKALGVNIGITEEQFLNSAITDITEGAEALSRGEIKFAGKAGQVSATAVRPVLRLYTASEDSFNLAVNMARFMYGNAMIDLYDAKTKKDIDVLKENGVGDLIMEQTGRWNKWKSAKDFTDDISFLIMAFRWTASRVSTAKNVIYTPAALADLTKRAVKKGGIKSLDAFYLNKTNVDKGRSALGLVLAMPIFASLLSSALSDDDKDFYDSLLEGLDPTKDFGKVVFGKTRFDATFGVASVISTVAKTIRLATDKQYGKDSWDPIARFLKNRQAPIISVINGMYEHARATFDDTFLPTDIMGEPETAGAFVRGTLMPIYMNNIIEYASSKDEEIGLIEASAAVFADVIGIGATTYSERASKAEILEEWGKASPLVKISKRSNLANKLSKEEFIQAEKDMEEMYLSEASRLMNSSGFRNMSREEKDKELQNLHRRIIDKLSSDYGVSEKKKKKYGLK